MWYGRPLMLRLVAVALLVGSALLAVSVSGTGLHRALAQPISSATARDFYIPAGSDPWGTSFDSSGHVWVAIPGCDPAPTCNAGTPPGKIAEYNPSSSSWMATYQLPAGYGQALFLAIDGQGRVWFAMPMDNAIGMLDPATNTYQQWGVPTANAGPWDVAIDHTGKIWFTEFYTNKIGRFDPGTHTFLEVGTATANSQPYGIVVDASNNVWFTENNSSVAQIGEYTAGGKMQEYKIRTGATNGLTPHLITVDTGGNIRWTEGWVGMIGKLTVGQAVPGTNQGVAEYTYPRVCNTCSTHTSGIGVDRNGLVWFDDADQGTFGSFPQSGSGSFTIYTAPTPSGHPYDGLAVDGQNRIWFDEECANKVVEVTQSGVPIPTPTNGVTSTPTPTLPPVSGPVSKLWYFAEGRVGAGFQEFLTLGNPTTTDCPVSITYLEQFDNGTVGTKVVTLTVKAATRVTRWVDQDLGTSPAGHGISVAATVTAACSGIVAERPMYFSALGTTSGSDVLGVTHTGTTFYFADMALGRQSSGNISSFLPILNPGSSTCSMRVMATTAMKSRWRCNRVTGRVWSNVPCTGIPPARRGQ